MIYLFSSIPETVLDFLTEKEREFRLVPKDSFKEFLAESTLFQKEDIGISYSYGKIFPDSLLQKLPIVNVHFSLLPEYRGAVPVEAAIIDGKTESGITLQWTDKKMDEGNIIIQQKIGIPIGTTAGDLRKEMDSKIPQLLDELFSKEISLWPSIRQYGQITYCYKTLLERGNAYIDFKKLEVSEIIRRVFAFNPQPYAWTTFLFMGKKVEVNIQRGEEFTIDVKQEAGSLIWVKKKGLVIFCHSGAFLITQMVIEGKKVVSNGEIVSLKGRIELAN